MIKKTIILLHIILILSISHASSTELREVLTKYAKNPKGWSALNYAIESDDYEVATKLVDFVKDPKRVDEGRNALYRVFERATKNEQTRPSDLQVNLIKKLLLKELDVHKHPDREPALIELAVKFDNEEIVMLLLNKKVALEETECVYSATSLKNYTILELLLKAGANINGNILVPLAGAVRSNDIQMVDFLLKHGANPNQELEFWESIEGNTSILGIALREERADIVELLLKNGSKLR